MAQIITQNWWWGWGSWGSYTAWCWIDITCNVISADTSVVQTTGNMVCDLTWADNDHYPSALAVANAISCSGGWDVMWPSCSTDWNVVLFDWATGKCIKDSWVSLSCKQDKLTAWANIDMTCAKVSATNTYIVTEDISSTTYTGTLWVAPYNTCYCYTNICIDPASWIEWKEWSIYTFDINTEMIATSACRNVRVKIWDGDYIPVMWTTAILSWSSYFTKANIRQYQYSTKYQACWALHLFTDSNTTYSAMTNAEATTGTCTSGRSIAACTLKCAINYYAPISDTAYWSWWNACTTTAPSQHAVYAKVNSIDALIPVAATCSNQLADKDYVNNWINSVTAYYITKNAQGDQFACYAELAAATTFYSWGVERVPTRNDYTIVLDDECYSDATTRYIYNSGWEYQYTVNETALTCAQLNALNSGITSAKVSCYDNCMAQCCDIPTDNCQLCNGCWYTTCTWTISNCAGIVSALWYTPYSSANPNGYTSCTWTLTAWDLTVVSWDTWCVYTIKKSNTAPSGAWSNTVTLVVE